jgi:transposase
MAVEPRCVSEQEWEALKHLARSRTAAARLVERAKIVCGALAGQSVAAVAREQSCKPKTVRLWLKRFQAHGVAGLQDAPRSGRPPTYTPEQVGELVALALTDPRTLGLPFGCWTLDRLVAYVREQRGLRLKRSRVDQLLLRGGLRWRTQETWFGERVDPQFAEKRGKSSGSARTHRTGAWSWISTRWARRAPRPTPASVSSRRYSTGRTGPPLAGRSRRSTMVGGAKGTCSGPCRRPPARC